MADEKKPSPAKPAAPKERVGGVFGKQAAVHDPRTLKMSAYLGAGLPTPPPAFDALHKVGANLKVKNPVSLFPMDGNDVNGCCTIAACAHAETIWDGWCSHRRVPTKAQVLQEYYAETGGPDSGLVEINVLRKWRNQGIAGERISYFTSIDYNDHDLVKTAIYLFGCVYVGFQVQEGALSDFRHHRRWKAGSPTGDGHAVILTGYDPQGPSLLTWGAVQLADWSWLDMLDEGYVPIPGQAQVKGFAPGFDYAALTADAAQFGRVLS